MSATINLSENSWLWSAKALGDHIILVSGIWLSSKYTSLLVQCSVLIREASFYSGQWLLNRHTTGQGVENMCRWSAEQWTGSPYYNPFPQSSKPCGDGMKEPEHRGASGKQSPGHVRPAPCMTLQKLWLPAQDLYKIKPVNSPVGIGKGPVGLTVSCGNDGS